MILLDDPNWAGYKTFTDELSRRRKLVEASHMDFFSTEIFALEIDENIPFVR